MNIKIPLFTIEFPLPTNQHIVPKTLSKTFSDQIKNLNEPCNNHLYQLYPLYQLYKGLNVDNN